MAKTYAVIMAGGAGTRFWPASRTSRPKQFLALGADEDESLLRATVRRLAPLVTPADVYIVTGEHLADATHAAVPDVPKSQVLREPIGRNTAPCIAWAAATIARTDPDAVIMVLPSDQTIGNEDEFRRVLSIAVSNAAEGVVTTVGIVPTRPETGYGYLELGEGQAGRARRVARFVEKPDRARAESYVSGKRHLWNAGMFFFRAKDMLALVDEHLPDLASKVRQLDEAARSGTEAKLLPEIFPTMPSISIDHGVMEKAALLGVVPGDFGWNDVGSWLSSWELSAKDTDENGGPPGAVFVDARENLVRDLSTSKKKVIALVGVTGLVVVETDDALLVLPKERAQDVRAVVDALKAAGRTDLL